MLDAAVEGAASGDAATGRCKVLAVSVLTSLDATELAEAWGRTTVRVEAEVLRLARLAEGSGLDGLVCSAHEAGIVRRELGDRLELLVPGIRVEGLASDQKRIATPSAAAAAGASYIVLGRTVVGAPDRRAAMDAVLADLGVERGGADPRSRGGAASLG
jgi:orotidine-5'-phosphate decarboxylase